MSLSLQRIEVVKAQVEGLSFSILIRVVMQVYHVSTYVDYINRNTIFSSNYVANICITLHGHICYIC